MRYISTRGEAPELEFDDVLLAGLARDGGLYVPDSWPRLGPEDWRALRGLPYAELAAKVMAPFLGGRVAEADFARMTGCEYRLIAGDEQLESTLAAAFATARGGTPVMVEVAIDYSQKTYFTKGILTTNFWRLPMSERIRAAARLAARKLAAA